MQESMSKVPPQTLETLLDRVEALAQFSRGEHGDLSDDAKEGAAVFGRTD